LQYQEVGLYNLAAADALSTAVLIDSADAPVALFSDTGDMTHHTSTSH